MSKRPPEKSLPEQSPGELAAQCVAERYDSLLESALAHTHGSVFQVTLDAAFERVLKLCEQEHVAEYGPYAADDEGVTREILAQDAGYLIGVQVGLRLRPAGGVLRGHPSADARKHTAERPRATTRKRS